MRRTRQAVAIAIVMTAALCADRAVAAAPSVRPLVGSVAGKLVSRLSVRFQRVVPVVRVYVSQRQGLVPAVAIPARDDAPTWQPTRLSPLLLHLPPPIL